MRKFVFIAAVAVVGGAVIAALQSRKAIRQIDDSFNIEFEDALMQNVWG